jgi:hypothetical protein
MASPLASRTRPTARFSCSLELNPKTCCHHSRRWSRPVARPRYCLKVKNLRKREPFVFAFFRPWCTQNCTQSAEGLARIAHPCGVSAMASLILRGSVCYIQYCVSGKVGGFPPRPIPCNWQKKSFGNSNPRNSEIRISIADANADFANRFRLRPAHSNRQNREKRLDGYLLPPRSVRPHLPGAGNHELRIAGSSTRCQTPFVAPSLWELFLPDDRDIASSEIEDNVHSDG